MYSITPFTTTDFPNHTAAVIWFTNCNMRCQYCYNPNIIFSKDLMSVEEIENFLIKRQNKLDGIVFSGGECTLHPYFKQLLLKAKELNFKTKVDTNGTDPFLIKGLSDYIDYIALDFKGLDSFKKITGSNHFKKFEETLEFLIATRTSFEVRTTVHSNLLTREEINQMIQYLKDKGYKGTYYLQNYLHVETLGKLDEQIKKIDVSGLNVSLRNF